MPDPALAEIAAVIRKHAPGALPGSLTEWNGSLHSKLPSTDIDGKPRYYHHPIPDDIAAAVLRDAMVRNGEMAYEYHSWVAHNGQGGWRQFSDSDHGNSSLLSCYAAWKWARGIE